MSRGGWKPDRRQLLQSGGVAAAAALLEGCGRRERVLIEQSLQRSSVPPGAERWRRSVCQQCPGSCEVEVRVIDGAAKKIEGDAGSPVSRGGVCALGHTALQALYSPHRPLTPTRRGAQGESVEVSWEEALAELGPALAASSGTVALCCGPDPVERAAVGAVARELDASVTVVEARHAAVERAARRRVWGRDVELAFDFEKADLMVTFGASVLDRWGNPVAQARAVADARARGIPLIHIGERMSLTAASADLWLPMRPGSAPAAVAMLERVLTGGPAPEEAAASAAGIPPDRLLEFGRLAGASRRPLLVAGAEGVDELEPVTRAFALKRTLGGVRAYDVSTPLSSALSPSAVGNGAEAGTAEGGRSGGEASAVWHRSLRELSAAVTAGEVNLVVALDVDPVAAAPASWGLEEALRGGNLVAVTSAVHRTAGLARWVLPAQIDLERVQVALTVATADGSAPVLQLADPVVEACGASRHPLDVLRSLAVAGGAVPEEGSWTDVEDARERLVERVASLEDARPASALRSALRGEGRLGVALEPLSFGELAGDVPPGDGSRTQTAPPAEPDSDAGDGLDLVLFEGARGERAGWGRPWLCELPDPVTTVMWGSWIELAPGDARRLGLDTGDAVTVSAEDPSGASRSVASTVFVHPACRPGAAFMPVGDFAVAGAAGTIDGDPRDLLGTGDVAGAPKALVRVRVAPARGHTPAPVFGRGLRRPEDIPAGWKSQHAARREPLPVVDAGARREREERS